MFPNIRLSQKCGHKSITSKWQMFSKIQLDRKGSQISTEIDNVLKMHDDIDHIQPSDDATGRSRSPQPAPTVRQDLFHQPR